MGLIGVQYTEWVVDVYSAKTVFKSTKSENILLAVAKGIKYLEVISTRNMQNCLCKTTKYYWKIWNNSWVISINHISRWED